jgi:hypothetical protein
MRIAPLILFTGVVLLAPSVRAQEGEINEQARAHFQAGVNSLQDPDGARYEEAYREFKAAYQSSPSWKILGNLGIAAMKLERDGEAIEAFQKYLAGGAASLAPEEREQFQRDLGTLQAGVVKLSIDVNVPGASISDERVPVTGSPVRNSYVPAGQHLEVGVRAGHHKITASAPGYEPAVWELEAVSGAAQAHTFELKRPVPVSGPGPGAGSSEVAHGSRPTPTGVYVGLAATGAFAVGAGVMGALALGKKSDFEAANTGETVAKAKDLHDKVKTFNLVTDVLIGAAVVSAGVVTYLYVSRPTVDAPVTGWLRLQPQVGLHSSSLQLEGAF